MSEFLTALLAFLASHSVPALPRIRARLVDLMGEKLYLALYGAVSLGILAWLISAAQRAPLIPLWFAGTGGYWVPIIVMPAAVFLLVGGIVAPNPLSVGFRAHAFDSHRPGIIGITRHPILWGFALWSGSHVVPNGDFVSVIMFGGFALFALAAMPMIDRRKKRQLGMQWNVLARATSGIPFAALLAGRGVPTWPPGLLFWTMGGTAAVYAALLLLHAPLFGPDPAIVFR